MHHGIEALELRRFDVAQVDPQRGDRIRRREEVAARVEIGVETDHVVSCGEEGRGHLDPEVAEMTSDQESQPRASLRLGLRKNARSLRLVASAPDTRRRPGSALDAGR